MSADEYNELDLLCLLTLTHYLLFLLILTLQLCFIQHGILIHVFSVFRMAERLPSP